MNVKMVTSIHPQRTFNYNFNESINLHGRKKESSLLEIASQLPFFWKDYTMPIYSLEFFLLFRFNLSSPN